MENNTQPLTPHPRLLEILFAFKHQVSSVYKEVLGLHELHHIAITRITSDNNFVILSSTPALEYNLFSGTLWHYDNSYNTEWVRHYTQDQWQNLYQKERYDELYYLKQIKHALSIGYSIADNTDNERVIYSLASHQKTSILFAEQLEDLYKMGQYCMKELTPLFDACIASKS